MLRKDYLQRQFEEFGKALSLLLNLKKKKDWEEFEKEMTKTLKRFTEIELVEVEKMHPEEFERKIILDQSLQTEQRKIMAILLYEKMNSHLDKEEIELYEDLKKKCLALYEQLYSDQTQNQFDLDVHYKLESLRNS